MANSEYIGLINCPLCGNENATVHEQKTGTKKGRRYYRCYETVNGSSMRCGTIQCIGPNGQQFINSAMRPIGQTEKAPAVEPVPVEPIAPPSEEPKKEPEPIAEPPARRGLLTNFLNAIGDE